jgi:hypothetical protein
MNVNWQNLGIAIKKGQAAYERSSNVIAPIGGTTIADYTTADVTNEIADANRQRGNAFVIADSLWGRGDRVN